MMASNQHRNKLKINDCWLFAISSKADLARRLSMNDFKLSTNELEHLSVDTGNFKLFSIYQSGKERPVQVPKRELQRIHRRIHQLLSRVQVPDYLHSAVKGKSYLTNARAHELCAPTIKIDVKKFFPSVHRKTIFRFFESTMQCRRDVAGILADLLTFDARLPTGSSASPIIAYYAFKPMFDALADLAEQNGLRMTCYVDDITMSGAKASPAILYKAHKIIARFGLKSHKMKAFSSFKPKVITGVCNTNAGERVPNGLHLKIKKGFYDLKNTSDKKKELKISSALALQLRFRGNSDSLGFHDSAWGSWDDGSFH